MEDSLFITEGLAYSPGAEAVIMAPGALPAKAISTPNPSILGLTSSTPWSYWGDANNAPAIMKDMIRHCGVLNAGIESKVRMAIGKGVSPYILDGKEKDGTENLVAVNDSEVNDWMEMNRLYKYSYKGIYNNLAYGWAATQLMLNKSRDYIATIKAADVYGARLERIGYNSSDGYIKGLYLCADWQNAPTSPDNDKIKRVEVLEEDNEYYSLQDQSSGYEFAMLHRLLKDGCLYYPGALWLTAQEWVAFTRSVLGFKNFLMKNQMTIKYVIIISEAYWKRIHKAAWDNYTIEKRKEIMDAKYKEIATYLTGEKNAGKTISAGRYYDAYSKQYEDDIRVDVIDDKMKDGKYLPDSAAADKQILFSMFFNPAIWGGNLLGDGASGGAGSGSDIREAYLVQLMLMESERQMNVEVLNLVKRFNGWSKRLEKDGKPLVWRYDTGILTTLDKGGSTQNATSGNIPVQTKTAA